MQTNSNKRNYLVKKGRATRSTNKRRRLRAKRRKANLLTLTLTGFAALILLVFGFFYMKERIGARKFSINKIKYDYNKVQGWNKQLIEGGLYYEKVIFPNLPREVKREAQEAGYKNPSYLDAKIKNYMKKEGINFEDVGISYYNFDTRTVYGLNEEEPFLAASTTKVPIALYIYDLVFQEGLDLDIQLEIGGNHMEGGTGILQEEPVGTSHSLRELTSLMITHSDNVATNVIYGFLADYNGEYLLNSLSRVYGIETNGGNYLSPKDGVYIMRIIYFNENRNPLYGKLVQDMENTIYNDYYTRKLKNENIAHKTGDFEGYYNDIGIYYGDEDYAFAVYTRNIGEKHIGEIGQIIHNWHKN